MKMEMKTMMKISLLILSVVLSGLDFSFELVAPLIIWVESLCKLEENPRTVNGEAFLYLSKC